MITLVWIVDTVILEWGILGLCLITDVDIRCTTINKSAVKWKTVATCQLSEIKKKNNASENN